MMGDTKCAPPNDDDDDNEEITEDDALCEMLGISSLQVMIIYGIKITNNIAMKKLISPYLP